MGSKSNFTIGLKKKKKMAEEESSEIRKIVFEWGSKIVSSRNDILICIFIIYLDMFIRLL